MFNKIEMKRTIKSHGTIHGSHYSPNSPITKTFCGKNVSRVKKCTIKTERVSCPTCQEKVREEEVLVEKMMTELRKKRKSAGKKA